MKFIFVCTLNPLGINKKLPLLVYFHGGGFIYKAAPYHYRLAKQYSKAALCKILFVDYRTTPNFCFPTPINDCFNALQWAINNTDLINIDKNKIAVGGDSAGGNLAAAAALMARDKNISLCSQKGYVYHKCSREHKFRFQKSDQKRSVPKRKCSAEIALSANHGTLQKTEQQHGSKLGTCQKSAYSQ